MIKYFRKIIAENKTYNELSRLSNRELNDIGISREEIRNIAKQHSFWAF